MVTWKYNILNKNNENHVPKDHSNQFVYRGNWEGGRRVSYDHGKEGKGTVEKDQVEKRF